MTAEAASPSPLGNTLSPRHQQLIDESAIAPEVASERGYRTITTKAELKRLGFADSQCRVPALLIPVFGVTGEIVTYQARPDMPRIKDGKALKYETPRGSRMALDVPVRCVRQKWHGDPKRPLFITEGARKADAGVSQGLCAIALLGVWNFRGTNEDGGKVALADWESVALNEREVYICFDSDVATKDGVRKAMERLKAFLESRGAIVRIIYLPPGEGGTKVGLDDYFAQGGTVDHLLGLAQTELRAAATPEDASERVGPYVISGGCTCFDQAVGNGVVRVELANFTARIIREIALDDGTETRMEFKIEARLGDRVAVIQVPAHSYDQMSWPTEALGSKAIVGAGKFVRDHLRVAVQKFSADAERETVYTHTGWRPIEGHGWCYLHAGGSIGTKGPIPEIQVQLPDALCGMVLPPPGEGAGLRSDIETALTLRELGPPTIMFTLLSAVFRAPMGDTDFAIVLFGATGTFKTEAAALAQSFYGAGFHARNLPGSFLSTANALEGLACVAKDMLFTVDDYVPDGSRQDVQRQSRDAGRLLRAQGNRAGRGRMSADATLKSVKVPRGLTLITAEELPGRQSARARAMILELGMGEIEAEQLTRCQALAAAGTFARVMSAFLQWVARRYVQLREQLVSRALELRAAAQADDRHRRTASQVAELQAGFEVFLSFAQEVSAITAERAEELRRDCWSALTTAAESQGSHHQASEPTELFLRLLRSAVGSGNAHIACPKGQAPENPEAFGWRCAGTIGKGEEERPVYHAQGARIGWVDGIDMYLDLDAALKAAQEMAGDTDRIGITVTTLAKRLHERGHLLSTEGDRGHLSVRRKLEGVPRRTVYHLHLHALTEAAQSAPSAPDHDRAEEASTPDTEREAGAVHPVPAPSLLPQPQDADHGSSTGSDSASECPARCRVCDKSRFWQLRPGLPWVCGTCHPPSVSAANVQWSEPGDAKAEGDPDA